MIAILSAPAVDGTGHLAVGALIAAISVPRDSTR